MKSIGIYGDSFTGITESPGFKFHWSSLLAQHYGLELTNYGLPGSPVYYSFNKFKDNFFKHDINIFLVSEPGRYFGKVLMNGNNEEFMPNLNCLINEWDIISKPTAAHLEGWFLCSDDRYNSDMTDLMITYMKTLDPNTIFIPCFFSSISQELRKNLGLGIEDCLYKLQEKQANYFSFSANVLISKYEENHDIISGHLIPEINEFIFQVILKKINTGLWNWTIPNSIKPKSNFNYLWRKL